MKALIRKSRSAVHRLQVYSNRWARRPLRRFLLPFKPDVHVDGAFPLLVHCGHHKVGTLWFDNVLRAVADHFGLYYQKGRQSELRTDTDVFHQAHSNFDFAQTAHYRGTHIVRDLRDVIVSGYFYHLWTPEAWAHRVEDRWNGMSFQEHLRSLDQEAGLLLEMDRFVEMNVQNFTGWNYDDPRVLEVRYEELLADEAAGFARIFRKYGFREDATAKAVEIALGFSFNRISNRKLGTVREGSHLRSGKPGEWQNLFTEKNRAHFKERIGPALVALGYERDQDW